MDVRAAFRRPVQGSRFKVQGWKKDGTRHVMTDEELIALDEWAAEKGMGWHKITIMAPAGPPEGTPIQVWSGKDENGNNWGLPIGAYGFRPSYQIAHTFILVEKLRELGWSFEISIIGRGEAQH